MGKWRLANAVIFWHFMAACAGMVLEEYMAEVQPGLQVPPRLAAEFRATAGRADPPEGPAA